MQLQIVPTSYAVPFPPDLLEFEEEEEEEELELEEVDPDECPQPTESEGLKKVKQVIRDTPLNDQDFRDLEHWVKLRRTN